MPRWLVQSGMAEQHMRGVSALVMVEDGEGVLGPLDELRPASEIRIGAKTTRERWEAWLTSRGAAGARTISLTRAKVAALAAERWPETVWAANRGEASGVALVVNARAVVPSEQAAGLAAGERLVEAGTGATVVAAVDGAELARALGAGGGSGDGDGVREAVWGLAERGRIKGEVAAPALMSRPWHARAMLEAALAMDLELLAARLPSVRVALGLDRVTLVPGPEPVVLGAAAEGAGVAGGRGLLMHPTARVMPGVILDNEAGVIALDEGAVVRPGATLVGPCWVGPHSTVLDKALIKANTAIGPWCKVAGEVGGTTFQGFANKAHDGHLGDSHVGEWANLGAGTTNSNLLNTYGEVIARATPESGLERTGRQFLGAIIGDHVKTAICTRMMTGCIIGTGTMWAASAAVTGTVAGFSWATDAGVRAFRFDKFMEVARAAMARRKLSPGAAYAARLEELSKRASNAAK